MQALVAIVLFFLTKFLYELWKSHQEEQKRMKINDDNNNLYDQAIEQVPEEEKQDTTEMLVQNNKGTRDLFLETLTKISCQYELSEDEDDNHIFFAYQGEHFFADATNEACYIHIFDPHWEHVELYDIDELARLKKAINDSNLNNSVTTIYTIDEVGSTANVHCTSTILFIPQIPRIEDYLRLELNEFFRAHRHVSNEMKRLKERENAQ